MRKLYSLEELKEKKENKILTAKESYLQRETLLENLFNLREMGFLSDEEFDVEEKKILEMDSVKNQTKSSSSSRAKEKNGCLVDLIKTTVIFSLLFGLAALKSCGNHHDQIKQPTKDINTIDSTSKTKAFLVQQSQREHE